jgi:flagellar hook protein FlgE
MGLTQALYTGLSGLDTNDSWMSVIGNNIANINTTGFKSRQELFQSQFYLTDQSGTAPSADTGGTNPTQVGLGASVASVQEDFSQGSIQSTGDSSDMAIDGNGFFIAQSASSGQQYTRDGSFSLSSDDHLVTSSGAYVQGYAADQNGNILPGKLTNLSIPIGSATAAQATTTMSLTGNLNAAGTVASGGSTITSQDLTLSPGAGGGTPASTSLLSDLVNAGSGTAAFTAGQTLTLSAQKDGSALPATTFNVTAGSTVQDLQNFFNGSMGIDTSAAGAGTTLVAGTAANSVDLQVVGNSGSANALTLSSTALTDQNGANPLTLTQSAAASDGESVTTSMQVFDSLGDPVSVNITAVLQSSGNAGTQWKYYVNSPDNKDAADPDNTLVGTGTLSFDTNGALISTTGNSVTIHRDGTGADPNLSIDMDFSGVSALAEDASHSGSELEMSSQNGIQLGTLTSFTVGTNGIITGSFDNGETRTMGEVAVATFNNEQGLQDDGGNMYSAAANSGSAVITTPSTLDAGQIRSGSLEQSNVDISKEFINMISASTGFSAASRVITTSDQLITDLLNSAH